jgi:Kef-type K+ transport system membrane component KefB
VACPSPLWAAAAAEDGSGLVVRLFFVFALMLLVGKFSGEAFERIGQPAVLGELIAGVLLGGSVLGVIPTSPEDPLTEIIKLMAEFGVVILLFEIGLETDLRAMFRVGPGASSVALVGVALPMVGGILFWISPLAKAEYSLAGASTTAVFLGATLTATSVGITARVLSDLGVLRSVESQLIIGAAVVDDVLGLVLLGLVSSLAAGQAVSVLGVARSLGVAVGFLVAAVAVGLILAPRIFGLLDRMRVRGMLLVSGFAFVLLLAGLADLAGSALIIGAFAAGVILSGTNQFDVIHDRIRPVADIFTPVFFLSIGAQLNVSLLNPLDLRNLPVLAVGFSLLAIAIVGKFAAGWAVPWRRFNRPAVGLGMMPRGEVGLIFANIGLNAGVLTAELFGAIMIMVMGTTFMAPPLLKWSFGRWGVTQPDEREPQEMAPHAAEPEPALPDPEGE